MTHASRAESASSSVDERSARTFEGLRNLVARVAPWLVDVGSWIFGGLTAINLVVISALITVGPVASAIKISTAALAAALPLNVAGILLLRLIKDLKDIGIDGLALRAFQDARFPHIDAYFPAPRERAIQHARRSRVALLYSMGVAALSIAFLVSSVVLSVALVTIAIAQGLPPESDAEKRLKRILAVRRHRDRRRR